MYFSRFRGSSPDRMPTCAASDHVLSTAAALPHVLAPTMVLEIGTLVVRSFSQRFEQWWDEYWPSIPWPVGVEEKAETEFSVAVSSCLVASMTSVRLCS